MSMKTEELESKQQSLRLRKDAHRVKLDSIPGPAQSNVMVAILIPIESKPALKKQVKNPNFIAKYVFPLQQRKWPPKKHRR